MPTASPSQTSRQPARWAQRSQLDDAPDAYRHALDIAGALDDAGLDLWAGDLRSCLDADSSTARQHHLILELTRLAGMSDVKRAGLDAVISRAVAYLAAGVGETDLPVQPLYSALRDLADHLEVHGAQRWLGRLRTVLHDTSRTSAARVHRLSRLLEAMTPDATGVPLESADKVRAVLTRLPRHVDTPNVAAYLALAVQRPAPSRAR
ncbi:hypothetical protein [Euzebya tangerina]|uniref:hypothetical protein n=1 Tax=Euzebya tangerina TaxID=591198 RepID=UPI0013C2F95B|nr:hypothetical protein [Euzebya tangerina]